MCYVYIQWDITQPQKTNTYESVLVKQMNLEPIIQGDVSQKEKNKYSKLKHIYEIQPNGTDEPISREGMQKQNREQT